jgi:hypothetical protein
MEIIPKVVVILNAIYALALIAEFAFFLWNDHRKKTRFKNINVWGGWF